MLVLKNVSGSRLNIRREPKPTAPRVGTLLPGAEVIVDENFSAVEGGHLWVKVVGKEEYISRGTVSQVVTFQTGVVEGLYLKEKA
jgi:hypothetical protein